MTEDQGPRRAAMPTRRFVIVGAILAITLGILVYKGLGEATVYFRTADQAVADRESLNGKTFRIEGTVVADSIEKDGSTVRFTIAGKSVKVPVVHVGDQPELFRAGIPVVLQGKFSGKTFHSHEIIVKHSETYEEQNPDRVKDYK